MDNCKGDGSCLEQCNCECYDIVDSDSDEDIVISHEICTCGHREHGGYCPSNCCQPLECRNYKFCKVKNPKWLADIHNGMCMNCAVQMGRHKVSDQVDECCVCLEDKNMIILNCRHLICNECWFKITKNDEDDKCPLCRSPNDWSSKK